MKAAIRSDRGGGTLVVDGGTYTTSGSSGAPAIYSTADITVSNATRISNDFEAVVVEGLNSATIIDSDVAGNMSGTYGDESGESIRNVMLYESMSGDAETGTEDRLRRSMFRDYIAGRLNKSLDGRREVIFPPKKKWTCEYHADPIGLDARRCDENDAASEALAARSWPWLGAGRAPWD